MIPTIKKYKQIITNNQPQFLRRRARYAPQLLADGLTSGIVDSQANLVHGAFDEAGSTVVDPYCDISSDKFALMQRGLDFISVDPSQVTNSSSEVSE